MKKLIKKILAMSMVTIIVVVAAIPVASAKSRFLGDVDNDEKVTTNDALMILQKIVNEKTEELEFEIADIDKDGKITSSDALMVLQTVVGIIQPVEIKDKNPLSYSKDQVVEYYNEALKKTYNQPEFTVQKKEVVDVQLGQMLLNGKPAMGVQSLANKAIENNKKNAGTKTQSFSSNPAVDAQARFILPANLYSEAVRLYNVSKYGAGYIVKFTLNEERCDYKVRPPFNSSCTFPLDIAEVDLGGIGLITSAQFYYRGTTLEATIDGSGRVVKTYVVMPLTVTGAQGEGVGQKLTVDISGQWLCTNIFSF